MYCPDAARWLDFRSASRKSKTDAFAHVVLECFLDAAHGDEFEHSTQNKREKFLKTTEVVNPGAQVPAVGGAHLNPTNVHIMFPQQTCAEKCTRASEGSIHRTVPEAHRPLRRGACSRNVEIGGERKAVGRVESNAARTANPVHTCCRCVHRGGPSPADGDGIAEAVTFPIPHSTEGRLRPGHRARSDQVDDRQTGGHEATKSLQLVAVSPSGWEKHPTQDLQGCFQGGKSGPNIFPLPDMTAPDHRVG